MILTGKLREYLTGFHKRKLERQKKAQQFHKEQERLAKIEQRKQIKLDKEKEMLEQLEKYKESMRIMNGAGLDSSDDEDDDKKNGDESQDEDEEEWTGFADDDNNGDDHEQQGGPKGILKKKEVYGEDATEVTIEELPNDIEEIAKLNYVNLKKSKKVLEESIDRAQKYAVIAGAEKPKQKKKKFRYLSKSERRQNNRKAITNKRRRD